MIETTMGAADIQRTLLERRREIQADVRERVREERANRPEPGRDDVEVSDAELQSHLTFTLLQMRSESLSNVHVALCRLRSGNYGTCSRCAGAITGRRLRVLPFAVHCRACAETLEGGRAAGALEEGLGNLCRGELPRER